MLSVSIFNSTMLPGEDQRLHSAGAISVPITLASPAPETDNYKIKERYI